MSEANEAKETPSEQPAAAESATPPSEAATTATDTGASSAAGGASSAAAESAAPSDAPSAASAQESVSPASTQADLAALAGPTVDAKKSSPGGGSKATDSAADAPKSSSGAAKSSHASASRSKTGEDVKSKAASSPSPSPSGRGASSGRRKRMKLGELDLSTAKIGFVGAGKMAESTINGLIHYAGKPTTIEMMNITNSQEKQLTQTIHVAAPSTKGLERFKALGCRVTKRNYDIFGRYDCDIIFLCFHGYVIKQCYKMGGSKPHPLTTNYIPHQRHPIYILSLVSGVSLSQIKACLLNPDSSSRYVLEIHRIMMNTAVGHGLGICAVDCEPDSKKLSPPLRQLLSSIAQLEHVPASQMDAACAIGGSGLAFSYYFINALADGAFKMGLSRQQAIRFASKTAQCAAQTMLESGKHPAELRDNVSAPSGAAIYGIHVLEKNDVASGVTAAVEAAHKRANDLATQEVAS